MLAWFRRAVGNGKAATVLIFVFIFVLCSLFFRCARADEVDFRFGSSFGPGGSGPVLGLALYHPLGNAVDLAASTNLWGATSRVANNWDWALSIRTCRWERICASIGASYLQRIDTVNGSHTNYYLGLSYLLPWSRVHSLDLAHLSDAGTTPVNQGRNAALVGIRLQ